MLAVVKKPHIEISGDDIPEKLIKFLTDNYQKVEIINDDDDFVDITDTSWYLEHSNTHLPGNALKRYRKRANISQKELGDKLGVAKQNISAMERGTRGISKANAHKLAEIFQTSPVRFI
ncbi:MAG: helix-turn-helix transcriptional regulator [Spirochaetia bacterium]|jgi:DNA-binding XRE family transcriptional regulator|nr:helix-turn-helix transcriptional regulator [Spirochaetia bacterium]